MLLPITSKQENNGSNQKINHVAIVVRDIEESLKFWEDQLGLKLDHIEVVPTQHSRVAFIPVGIAKLNLFSQPALIQAGSLS